MNRSISIASLALLALVLPGCSQQAEEQVTYEGIYQACLAGDTAAIKKYLEEGADANTKGGQGMSCIAATIVSRNKDAFDALKEAKADLTIKDDRGWNLLHFAATNDQVEIMEELVKAGLPLDELTKQDGASAYQLAKVYRGDAAAKWLEKQGADTTMRKLTGPTRSASPGG
ncbi:ankyrin repeat domain-containing protein [Kamptonema cortianum]|nr:ankyrin repeat domain-containing protein [Geitlerinema splendidum]MDK3160457.1 ankyrin repeat domain-containing protein [Kamptonema cortianum]